MRQLRVVDSLRDVPHEAWNALLGGAPAELDGAPAVVNPFLRHEFLSALIETGCASARAGWHPQFLLHERDGMLAGAMPLFLKSHSYGEYVFDWAWAAAYQRHGLEYYPKLLGAVPFTPVEGPRLLAAEDSDRRALIAGALELASQTSSLHVLFPNAAEAGLMREHGMLLRETVQFHWRNEGYADFADFLARLSRVRRKNIRQERRRVREAGGTVRWLRGAGIGPAHWEFFNRCYRNTYRGHGSSPYLSLAFFQRIGATLPEHTLLVLAEREDKPIAAALDFVTTESIYGRYWGALEHVPLLHFEACYYQAIEFAIAHGLKTFEGGAQGEHKLFRGLMPVRTLSAHWLTEPRFFRAIEDYLERESAGIGNYVDELNEHSPFR